MSQLKNKIQGNLFQPQWQLSGIFITAIILAIIQLRWTELFIPGGDANLAYGAITFFSILLVYATDHLFDLIKYELKYETQNKIQIANIIIAILATLGISIFLAFNINVLDFEHFWIPLLPSLVYAIIAMRMVPHIRGLKEFIIAATVAVSLCYPFIQNNLQIFYQFCPPVFLVCYMNVILFSFFEKSKDDHFEFHTVYKNKSDYQALKHLTTHFIAVSLGLIVCYFFIGTKVFPFFAIAVIYWVAIPAKKKLLQYPIVRILLDMVLLIMIF